MKSSLLINQLYLILLLTLTSSCTQPLIDFQPQGASLPAAMVGSGYHQIILIGHNIEVNPGFLDEKNTSLNIYPEDSGLYIYPSGKNRLWSYNNLVIQGVPNKVGRITVKISGFTRASMLDKSQDFSKTYTIMVGDNQR